MDMLSTCCFIGCRRIPQKIIRQVLLRLNSEVEALIKKGVKTFISGGTPGFEQITTSLIVARKEMGGDIRLNFILPCRDLGSYWNSKQREFYNKLLAEADGVFYVSNQYHDGCLKKQIRFMVDNSSYCICAVPQPTRFTRKAIRYARRKGLKIIHVA